MDDFQSANLNAFYSQMMPNKSEQDRLFRMQCLELALGHIEDIHLAIYAAKQFETYIRGAEDAQ